MVFAKKNDYGVTEDVFLNRQHISYANLCEVKTPLGLTIGNATAIDKRKQICLKKCFSEYLERFALGIPIGKIQKTDAINLADKSIEQIHFSDFGYGDSEYGHNDTTGTATGYLSEAVISKALCELIEKNEALCFWYSEHGKRIIQDENFKMMLHRMNFISTEFYGYVIHEISNFPTVIILGFHEERLLTTGIACTDSIEKSLEAAIEEAKIIEWQQYNNEKSGLYHYSKEEREAIRGMLHKKNQGSESIKISDEPELQKELQLADWVQHIYIKVIYADEMRGLKTVKCISKELLSSIPIKENIEKTLNKEIVQRYYKNQTIDCPIL